MYGANTDVGKTILSTVLCKALGRRTSAKGLLYLKPVSTGPQSEADDRYVMIYEQSCVCDSYIDRHIKRYVDGVVSKCISQYAEPVSPHLAARDFIGSKQVRSRFSRFSTASDQHRLLHLTM